jgi:hypothetical protein
MKMILEKLRLSQVTGFWLIGCAISFAVGTVVGRTFDEVPSQLERATRVNALVDELIISPERQQRALDEIAKDGDGAYTYLLQHLDDTRPLASGFVHYLSTHPKRPERYSLVRSKTVGEALLRYLCWSTESCEFGYEEEDKESKGAQRRKVDAFIGERWLAPPRY